MLRSSVVTAIAAAFLLAFAGPADAQFGKLKDKAKDKLKKKAEETIDKKADEAIDGAAEAPAEGTGEAAGEAGKAAGGAAGGEATEAGAAGSGGAAGDAAAAQVPGQGVWANYDFVPGDRILFFDDFSTSPVGDFPPHLEFIKGNMETVESQGRRYLRATSYSEIDIPLPEILPERYTIEFDYYGPHYGQNQVSLYFDAAGSDQGGQDDFVTFFHYLHCGVNEHNHGDKAGIDLPEEYQKGLVRCRIMGNGRYLKVYGNDIRVSNVPNAVITRTNKIRLNLWAEPEKPLMIGTIRVAEGGKKLYDALQAQGRVATQGIYFDTGSDRLRPESTPTLTEIGKMLEEHAELKLRIEGHTDNVGDDAANLDLSKRRAAAVKAWLVDSRKIDTGRLETEGFGETKPVGDNGTPEGRQSNRRVELVKL